MFITCKSDNCIHGYYLNDIKNIDELHEHIKKEMPIKCRRVRRIHRQRIVLESELDIDVLVYLNNYLKIQECFLHFMSDKEYMSLENKTCSQCKWFDRHSIRAEFNCEYAPCTEGCLNFEKEYTLMESLKMKLKLK